jgi:hypothetical protein
MHGHMDAKFSVTLKLTFYVQFRRIPAVTKLNRPLFLSYQHFPKLSSFEALGYPRDLRGHHGKMKFVSFLGIGNIFSWGKYTPYILRNMEPVKPAVLYKTLREKYNIK